MVSRSGQPARVQPEDLALDRAYGKIGKSTDLACPGAVRHHDGVGADGLPVGQLNAGYPTIRGGDVMDEAGQITYADPVPSLDEGRHSSRLSRSIALDQ